MNIEVTINTGQMDNCLKIISEAFPKYMEVVAYEVFKQLISNKPDYHDTFNLSKERRINNG